ncbi:MAG: pyruvate kinase [Candidatus Krumholzibacteriia bacterium]
MIRTKIVCTIGPATWDRTTLERLVAAGMNVARLNFSHGTHDEHAEVIRSVREIAADTGRPLAILQDLAGPKIRTGNLAAGPVVLEAGQEFVLTARDVPGDAEQVGLTYPELPQNLQVGDRLLLADGAMELRVVATSGSDVRTLVVNGGELGSFKGINLPDRSVNAPILTDKDRADLDFGLEQRVDYVALSFVRNAHDVLMVRDILKRKNREVPLVAKIEKHEALRNIDEILELVDGLMVARGDLGVEIPVERVPGVQKMLIRKANAAAKPVITATQMLRSMVDNPRPTRAEVTDVANAILDGTDAVMLSEETAVGHYPVEAVGVMVRVAADIEQQFPYEEWTQDVPRHQHPSVEEAVAHGACRLADEIRASAIVTLTRSGSTTRKVVKYRPRQRVMAVTPDETTYRRLALVWGAQPLRIAAREAFEEIERDAIATSLEAGTVAPGDKLVITAGMPFAARGTTNLIKVTTAEWTD